jgi:hypothetical protein
MLTERDLELLSAYLDGALTEAERADLEARLQTDAELSRELARLRATVDLVRTLPTLSAPRDFTLTRDMVRRQPRILTSAAFSVLSAAAAFVMLVLGATLLLPQLSAPNAAMNVQVAAVPTQVNTQPPQTQAVQEIAPSESGGGAAAPEVDESSPTLERSQADGLLASTTLPTAGAQGTLEPLIAADALIPPTGTLEAFSFAQQETATGVEEALDDSSDVDTAQRAATATEQSAAEAQESESMPAPAAANSAAEDTSSAMVQQATQLPTSKPSETLTPSPMPTATATPSFTPSPTATETAPPTATFTPSASPSFTPQPTFTATPVPGFLERVGSSGIGLGLIVVAILLLGVALITTILRRRS